MTRSTRRVLSAGVALGLALTTPGSCFPEDPGTPPGEARGRITYTRTESAAGGGVRVVATVADDEGHEWTVRLPADTPCRVGSTFPDCAG